MSGRGRSPPEPVQPAEEETRAGIRATLCQGLGLPSLDLVSFTRAPYTAVSRGRPHRSLWAAHDSTVLCPEAAHRPRQHSAVSRGRPPPATVRYCVQRPPTAHCSTVLCPEAAHYSTVLCPEVTHCSTVLCSETAHRNTVLCSETAHYSTVLCPEAAHPFPHSGPPTTVQCRRPLPHSQPHSLVRDIHTTVFPNIIPPLGGFTTSFLGGLPLSRRTLAPPNTMIPYR